MERKLKNGDYIPSEKGGLTVVTGTDALLQRVLFRLTARRGAFPFLPQLGSKLYLLPREKPSARQALAMQYAVQALEEETEVKVTGVTVKERDGVLDLTVALDRQGQALHADVTIGEGTDEDS